MKILWIYTLKKILKSSQFAKGLSFQYMNFLFLFAHIMCLLSIVVNTHIPGILNEYFKKIFLFDRVFGRAI